MLIPYLKILNFRRYSFRRYSQNTFRRYSFDVIRALLLFPRGTGRPIQTVTMPELHQEPDMPGEDAAAAHHQPESKVSFSVYDVTVSSDLDESYQQMENGGQKEKSRSSHGLNRFYFLFLRSF